MTQSKTNGQETELLSIQCSFGDNVIYIFGVGGGLRGEGERGYSPSIRPWIFSQFNFMKAEKERAIFNL